MSLIADIFEKSNPDLNSQVPHDPPLDGEARRMLAW